jgi:hypothetical protein
MSEPKEFSMNERDDQAADRLSRELPAELKALEARMAALVPRDDCLDRERLMFLAGRASVEGPLETGGRMPRAWLESKAWPAAFAGMTAVAAALLVGLIARPVAKEPTVVQVASDRTRPTFSEPFVERNVRPKSDVLSPSDARRDDIETFVSGAGLVAAVDAPSSPSSEQDRSTLTPGAWRQLIEPAEVLRPDVDDSSDVRISQGAKT